MSLKNVICEQHLACLTIFLSEAKINIIAQIYSIKVTEKSFNATELYDSDRLDLVLLELKLNV